MCGPRAITYPVQVTVGFWRGHHSVVGVDDGHDVHAQQLLQRAVEVLPLFVVVEIQVCHQNLAAKSGERHKSSERKSREVRDLGKHTCAVHVLY